jgi:ATP-dependent DNA helicase RecG
MRSNPRITVSEIAEKLGMSRTAADKNIQILKSQGYVERIGAAKGGFWQVKEAKP